MACIHQWCSNMRVFYLGKFLVAGRRKIRSKKFSTYWNETKLPLKVSVWSGSTNYMSWSWFNAVIWWLSNESVTARDMGEMVIEVFWKIWNQERYQLLIQFNYQRSTNFFKFLNYFSNKDFNHQVLWFSRVALFIISKNVLNVLKFSNLSKS